MSEVTEHTSLLDPFTVPRIFTQPGAEKMTDEAYLRPDVSIPPCERY